MRTSRNDSSSFFKNYFYWLYLCQFTSHRSLSVKITFLSIYRRFISYFSSWYFFFIVLFSFVRAIASSPCFLSYSFYFRRRTISYYIFFVIGSWFPKALSIAYSLLLLKLLYNYSKLPRKLIDGWFSASFGGLGLDVDDGSLFFTKGSVTLAGGVNKSSSSL